MVSLEMVEGGTLGILYDTFLNHLLFPGVLLGTLMIFYHHQRKKVEMREPLG
jgi:hypothetical protein